MQRQDVPAYGLGQLVKPGYQAQVERPGKKPLGIVGIEPVEVNQLVGGHPSIVITRGYEERRLVVEHPRELENRTLRETIALGDVVDDQHHAAAGSAVARLSNRSGQSFGNGAGSRSSVAPEETGRIHDLVDPRPRQRGAELVVPACHASELGLVDLEKLGHDGPNRRVRDGRPGRMCASADDEVALRCRGLRDFGQEPRLADARFAEDVHPLCPLRCRVAKLTDGTLLLFSPYEIALRAERRVERRPKRANAARRWRHGRQASATFAAKVLVWRRARAAVGARNDGSTPNAKVLEHFSQRRLHLSRKLKALFGRLGERLHRELGQAVRDLPVRALDARVGNRIVDMPQDDASRGVIDVRKVADHELVEHHAKRVQVAATVDRIAAALLGRHVIWGAANEAGFGDRTLLAHDRGKTEVDDFHEVLARTKRTKNDVFRLEIAVHDAELVCLAERVERVDEDVAHALERERTFLVHDQGQVLAAQELHRQIENAVVRPSEIDDADAVGMVEPARCTCFLIEPRDGLLVTEQMRVDHLDSDGSAERRLFGLVDSTHPADADDLLQQVRAADDTTH